MNRRDFLALGAGAAGGALRLGRKAPHQVFILEPARQPVLVRSGFTRKRNGPDERAFTLRDVRHRSCPLL